MGKRSNRRPAEFRMRTQDELYRLGLPADLADAHETCHRALAEAVTIVQQVVAQARGAYTNQWAMEQRNALPVLRNEALNAELLFHGAFLRARQRPNALPLPLITGVAADTAHVAAVEIVSLVTSALFPADANADNWRSIWVAVLNLPDIRYAEVAAAMRDEAVAACPDASSDADRWWPVSRIVRAFGVSRQAVWKWIRSELADGRRHGVRGEGRTTTVDVVTFAECRSHGDASSTDSST